MSDQVYAYEMTRQIDRAAYEMYRDLNRSIWGEPDRVMSFDEWKAVRGGHLAQVAAERARVRSTMNPRRLHRQGLDLGHVIDPHRDCD